MSFTKLTRQVSEALPMHCLMIRALMHVSWQGIHTHDAPSGNCTMHLEPGGLDRHKLETVAMMHDASVSSSSPRAPHNMTHF